MRPVSMRSKVDLPEPEGPSRAMILPGFDGKVGGRDDLDAISVGLRVVFFDGAGFNDRVGQGRSPERVPFQSMVGGMNGDNRFGRVGVKE